MTVQELIAKLTELNKPEAEVRIFNRFDWVMFIDVSAPKLDEAGFCVIEAE